MDAVAKGGGTYGQDGRRPLPPLFEILEPRPSIISAPMIPLRFFVPIANNQRLNRLFQTNIYVFYYASDDNDY